jgi:hypothetical protein
MSDQKNYDDVARRGFWWGIVVGTFLVGLCDSAFFTLGMSDRNLGEASPRTLVTWALVLGTIGIAAIIRIARFWSEMEVRSAQRVEERRRRDKGDD